MTSLAPLLDNYYNTRLRLFPLEATVNGVNLYNDQLPVDISESYRKEVEQFFQSYLDSLNAVERTNLNETDQISYDILKRDLEIGLEGFKFNDQLTPINQFWSLPLTFGMMGSGQSTQPFKTVKDYDNFLGRINGFERWCDTAIANMKEGMKTGITNPRIVMEKVLPQLKAMVSKNIEESIFYQPVKNIPSGFSKEDKTRIKNLYVKAITSQVIPAYKKLHDFIEKEYLPACRTSVGIGEIPNGKEYYNYQIKYWTTTTLTADEIFKVGEQQVKKLREEMEQVMKATGYTGDLKSFFKFMNTDARFFPYKSAKEVTDAYHAIHDKIKPQLAKLFDLVPKAKFEIKQTEKFREASASAEYQQGTPDGTRPGIFYVPIPDPKKFNTFAMESLFLHEAIPGHHYQISLQQENTELPSFRRFGWYGAYGEGWALYTESLGKGLGLYTDPYQYFGALSEEMHRAIRLVVDVGLHVKGWTREQAIQFSMENEGESEEAITSEVERYIAVPGQALSYKIGQLKILELRAKAEKGLGNDFNLAEFHRVVLDGGCLPLSVLESKVNHWLSSKKEKG